METENPFCFFFGHRWEVRFFTENKQWGKPWGEPRIKYNCERCRVCEEITVPWETTGRSESECWLVPVSDKRGKLESLHSEIVRYRRHGGFDNESNWYRMAYKLKSRGEIVYFADNT